MFSVVLGTALGKLGSAGKPLLDFLSATSEAMMIITHWVIWYANKSLIISLSLSLVLLFTEMRDYHLITGYTHMPIVLITHFNKRIVVEFL